MLTIKKTKPRKGKLSQSLEKKRLAKKKRRASNPVPRLKRSLWKLVSSYIRNRDNWTCYTCGKKADGYWMHAGHFITRQNAATLFDPRNLRAQCATCNIYLRGNVAVYAQRLMVDLGEEGFNALVQRGKQIKQWDERGLRALIEVLKKGGDFDEEYEKIYKKY